MCLSEHRPENQSRIDYWHITPDDICGDHCDGLSSVVRCSEPFLRWCFPLPSRTFTNATLSAWCLVHGHKELVCSQDCYILQPQRCPDRLKILSGVQLQVFSCSQYQVLRLQFIMNTLLGSPPPNMSSKGPMVSFSKPDCRRTTKCILLNFCLAIALTVHRRLKSKLRFCSFLLRYPNLPNSFQFTNRPH